MSVISTVAGLGYFLQKVFLLIAEGDKTPKGRRFRIAGWVAYLIGLPMWMVIFVLEGNLILIFIEGGGVPSMVLGLIVAIRGQERTSVWLDRFAATMAFVGIIVSLYHFGGLVRVEQGLEMGIAIGFLGGTYFLAKKNPNGWLWYMLMNSFAGILMWAQGYPVLTGQQASSLIIVIMAYRKARKAVKTK